MVKKKIRLLLKQFILACALLTFPLVVYSADYYWRASPSDNLFTNVGNWETSPGGGLSPSLAPSINDDVFFPVATTITSINLNSGNCRDFNVTVAMPTAFTFTGSLTALNGSLNCPNGNATFNFSGTQNFTGAGSHFINIGTSAIRMNGRITFNNGTGLGSYTLSGPFNISGSITFNAQSFNTNGFPLSGDQIVISGNTTKTVNFSNSLITINKIGFLFGSIQFLSPHTSTSYILSGTHIVINDSATISRKASFIINPGVQIVLDTLTFNKTATTTNSGVLSVNAGSASPATITINNLRLNVADLALGGNNFDITPVPPPEAILNIGNIVFLGQCLITVDRKFTLNVGAITEAPVCNGQSAIVCVGYSPVFLNPTVPIVTSNVAYYGVTFGGSGVTTSSSNDLGNNNGSITWGAAISGISYWWVGGTGNWNDPTKWSIIGSGGLPQSILGCVPTIYDNVVFDGSSFSGSQTVTIADGDAYCNSISWTGSNQGLLAGGTLISGDIYSGNLFIKGDANFSGARGITANLFYVGSGTHSITSGSFFSYTSPTIKIMSTGTRSLTDNLIGDPAISYLQHTAGTFNSAGFTVDVAHFCSRSYPEEATNLRTLTVTNSQINIRSAISSIVAGRRQIDLSFLSAFNASNSDFRIHSNDPSTNFFITKGNISATYLSIIDFNDISFTASSGTPLFFTSTIGGGSYTSNFNNINFASNGQIACAGSLVNHNVNNYNFTSGSTYSFTQSSGISPVFNVLTNINHSVSSCAELIRIQSRIPGNQVRINKSSGTFNVNGAIVSDINSVGVTMNVLNGVDAGNNSNVTISSAASRTMYWVNNTGNWSDGSGHWSIGVSGGNPAVTNPLGCIPRVVDDVVFDNNSFSLSGQTVTLNVEGNCRNMLWTSAAGSNAPIFAGASSLNLNVYGSIELGSGMMSSFTGRIYMLGTNTAAMSQTIDMNGVSTNGSIWLSGGGRYDLTDSIRIVNTGHGIRLDRGNFVTNGHNIYSSAMSLDVTGSNAANISNSHIRLFSSGFVGVGTSRAYSGAHSASGTWNALGSTIESTSNVISIENANPITYGSIIMNGGLSLLGFPSQTVTLDKVDWITTPPIIFGGGLMDGRFIIDTLRYPISSLNTFQTGGLRSYTIVDTLIAFGTPCNPTFLRSASPGSAVTLNSSSCNFDFNFVNLRDINAGTCTAAENKSIGTDEGGNTNWTITSIPALTRLGNDTDIVCAGPFITLDAIGFGSIPGISYTWNTGSSLRSINVNSADTYSVVVNYGAGCEVSDSLIVGCSSILPLRELKLHGIALTESNQLYWETLSESGLSHFWVERSDDGKNYKTIGQVKALGNSSFSTKYEFQDTNPLSGTGLYRIRQFELDGQSNYSNTISINRKETKVMIEVHPNPAHEEIEITFPEKGAYDILFLDLLGHVTFQEKVTIHASKETKKIESAHWTHGLYLLQIRSKENTEVHYQKIRIE